MITQKEPKNRKTKGISAHIKVRVFTDSSLEVVTRSDDNTFRVFLREPAKQGLANKRLLKVLHGSLEPKPRRLRIVTGEHSPSKVIAIEY